jgi:hypothetical protein
MRRKICAMDEMAQSQHNSESRETNTKQRWQINTTNISAQQS